MRVTTSIAINVIDVDHHPINKKTLELAIHLKEGGTVPPVHLQPVGGGRFKVMDGRHRLLAHKLLGMNHILAHYALVESPSADKPLVTAGEGHVPQADGSSLPHGVCLPDL